MIYMIIKSICARNPAVVERFSADPSAHLWPTSDRLWVYASHDHDNAEDMVTMSEYYVYSTVDMVRWPFDRSPTTGTKLPTQRYTGNHTSVPSTWKTHLGR